MRQRYFHVECLIGGTLRAFYTLDTNAEAEAMMQFYRDRPEWHLYSRVIGSGPDWSAEWSR